jgi:putative transposase
MGPQDTMHTYTSIYIHVVFATWSRKPLLEASIRANVHAYIAATARKLGVDDIHAGGHVDHIHLFGRFDPAVAPSAVIGAVKKSTTDWIHAELNIARFRWQRGFNAFSVSRDRVRRVVRYIQRQEEHHRRHDFREELELLLRQCGVALEDVHLL